MILDGAVPLTGESDRDAYATRIEETVQRLAATCDLWSACPIADVGLVNAVDQVSAELQENGNIGQLEMHHFDAAIGTVLSSPIDLLDVAEGLALALDGDGGLLHEIGMYGLTPMPDGGFREFTSGDVATICGDGWNAFAGTADELLEQAERTGAANPATGPFWDIPCDLWPVTGSGISPVNYTGSTPILVVGNTDDTFTPLEFGHELVNQLGNATLLTHESSDHTAVFNSHTCIDQHALAYLIEGVMPAEGTVCQMRGLVGLFTDDGPVVVNYVTPGSAAEAGGLLVGDVVLEFDGVTMRSNEDYPFGPPQSEAIVRIERDGEEMEFTLTRGLPVWELWRSAE